MKADKRNQQTLPRVETEPHKGLTDAQAKERLAAGLGNRVKTNLDKSNIRIFCENAFTFFNCVLYAIGLLFLGFMIFLRASGHEAVEKEYFGITKFIFLISVIMNVTIGTVQGIKAKQTLKKLRIVNRGTSKVVRDSQKVDVPMEDIVIDDVLFLSQGDQVPVDLIVQEGEVQVDESLLTGEADLVKKKPGDTLYSGSVVFVGSCYGRAEKVADDTYASQLAAKVKSLQGHKSELMVSIYRIINVCSILLFVIVAIVIGTLIYKSIRWGEDLLGAGEGLHQPTTWAKIFVTTASFAIGVIPTGLVLLTSMTLAVSIMKLSKEKTLVQELYALENLSRVDVICLDKTGTLTDGTMSIDELHPLVPEEEMLDVIRHILGCFETTNMTSKALLDAYGWLESDVAETIPFSSATKCSGYKSSDGVTYLMGAPDYIAKNCKEAQEYSAHKAKQGKRVIAVTRDGKCLGLVALEDGIRASAKDTLRFFYDNGVDVRIISGDNPITVSRIASLAGVKGAKKAISLEGVPLEQIPQYVKDYVVFARVSPEQKQAIVESLQALGHKVAMTGDGVNDILALRKANASITFDNATTAAKSCSDVVLLDNDFSHLKAVVGEVNNVERTAVLMIMKTIAVAALSLALIPFKEGQMSYSLENVYLLETAIIGTGGFLLSLEPTKEPIRGSFNRNVFAKAIPSGLLVWIGAMLPILLTVFGLYGARDSAYTMETRTSIISLMTAAAGLSVLASMSIPWNRFRTIAVALVAGNVALFGLALPRVFIGAHALNFSDVDTILHEMFQPWNARALHVVFFTETGDVNLAAILTVALFIVFAVPFYYFSVRSVEWFLNRRGESDKAKREASHIQVSDE